MRRHDCDADWQEIADNWSIREGTTYLNHGSFGFCPTPVRQAAQQWSDRLNEQPMDFFVRQMEPALQSARERLAAFVGTDPQNLVFVENATAAMNIVAASFPLKPGDEVLLNDHEYGAVQRIWQRAAERQGAICRVIALPQEIESPQQVVDCLEQGINDRTRLIVISHITSPTALIMPVEAIAALARRRGVAVCIDGPHAPAQLDLQLDQLDCDYYTASCHKWLSAPVGSGFFYCHPRRQEAVEPANKSWGRLLPAIPQRWDEEFVWSGTRDPAAYLAVASAIDFLEGIGLDNFRRRCDYLAGHAENCLVELTGQRPIAGVRGGDYRWYGAMAHVPLPAGNWETLQDRLWRDHGIEVPIIGFGDSWYVRVSCYLYNTEAHIEYLAACLKAAIGQSASVLG